MAQISSKFRSLEGGGLIYYCEGCRKAHMIMVGEGPGPRWSWNGDLERPVFSPSVLSQGREMTPAGRAAWEAWIDAGHPEPTPEFESAHQVCHTFVGCNGAQPGEIIFLGDCTHELAGQVRPFADLPDWLLDE